MLMYRPVCIATNRASLTPSIRDSERAASLYHFGDMPFEAGSRPRRRNILTAYEYFKLEIVRSEAFHLFTFSSFPLSSAIGIVKIMKEPMKPPTRGMFGGLKRTFLVGVQLLEVFQKPCCGQLLEHDEGTVGLGMQGAHCNLHELLHPQPAICERDSEDFHTRSSSLNLDSIYDFASPVHFSRHGLESSPLAVVPSHMMETYSDPTKVGLDLSQTLLQERFNFDFTPPTTDTYILSASQTEPSPIHYLQEFNHANFEWGTPGSKSLGKLTADERPNLNLEASQFMVDFETALERQQHMNIIPMPIETHNIIKSNENISLPPKSNSENFLGDPLMHYTDYLSFEDILNFGDELMPTAISSKAERHYESEVASISPMISPTTSIDVAKESFMPELLHVPRNENEYRSTFEEMNDRQNGKHQPSWEKLVLSQDFSRSVSALDDTQWGLFTSNPSDSEIHAVQPFVLESSDYNPSSLMQDGKNQEVQTQPYSGVGLPSQNFVTNELELWEALTQDQALTPTYIEYSSGTDAREEELLKLDFHKHNNGEVERDVNESEIGLKLIGSKNPKKLAPEKAPSHKNDILRKTRKFSEMEQGLYELLGHSKESENEVVSQEMNGLGDIHLLKEKKRPKLIEDHYLHKELGVMHSTSVNGFSKGSKDYSALGEEVGDGLEFLFWTEGTQEISDSPKNEPKSEMESLFKILKKRTRDPFFECQPPTDIWTDDANLMELHYAWRSYTCGKNNEKHTGLRKLQKAAEIFFPLADKEAEDMGLNKEIENTVENLTLNLCRNILQERIGASILGNRRPHHFILKCMDQVRNITKGLLLLVRILHTIFRDTQTPQIGIRKQQLVAWKFVQIFWNDFTLFQKQASQQYSWIINQGTDKSLVQESLCTFLYDILRDRKAILDKTLTFKLGAFWLEQHRNSLYSRICLSTNVHPMDSIWTGFINTILVFSGPKKTSNKKYLSNFMEFKRDRKKSKSEQVRSQIEQIIVAIEKSKTQSK